MQIGRTCSKMYSNLRFPEVVGVDGSLFATGGDEEEPAEWGVVLLFSQRDESKPSSFPHEENKRLTQNCFS